MVGAAYFSNFYNLVDIANFLLFCVYFFLAYQMDGK